MEGRNELEEMFEKYEDRLIEMFEEGIEKHKELKIFNEDWIQVSVEIRYHLWNKIHLIYSYNTYPKNTQKPIIKVFQSKFHENPVQFSKLHLGQFYPSYYYRKIICQYGDKILENFNTEFEKAIKKEKEKEKRESQKEEKQRKERMKEVKEAKKQEKVCVENLKRYLRS